MPGPLPDPGSTIGSAAGCGVAHREALEAGTAAVTHQEADQARAASEPPRVTTKEPLPPLDGQREQRAPHLADAFARVSLLPAAHAAGREAGAALPRQVTAACSMASGAPAAPLGQVPCPPVQALLVEVLVSKEAPHLASLCWSADTRGELRQRCNLLMAECNAALPDSSVIELSQTPGAAAVVAYIWWVFCAGWARCGDAAVEAARRRGIGWEAQAALLRSFLVDVVDAGYLRGLPEARTCGQVFDLAACAAREAAQAVGRGAASPLSLCPPLPPGLIGGPPGSRAAADLVEVMGPYALYAR